ncbi:MAG: YkgJ family cysteine cluster protein [Bacteroidales bacterium]|jgi:Fe-S-cluster containining protein|nr:YkgJ family cysteine cluster protein [Bacteroidales bacterium]
MAENNNFEKETMTFHCVKCGECCRHLESFAMIWPHQSNGVCNYLKKNLCSIYDDRPDFCDFKRWYKYYKATMSEKEYYERVKYNCDQLKNMKESGGNVAWFHGMSSKHW